jgi:hypothetical protein
LRSAKINDCHNIFPPSQQHSKEFMNNVPFFPG